MFLVLSTVHVSAFWLEVQFEMIVLVSRQGPPCFEMTIDRPSQVKSLSHWVMELQTMMPPNTIGNNCDQA